MQAQLQPQHNMVITRGTIAIQVPLVTIFLFSIHCTRRASLVPSREHKQRQSLCQQQETMDCTAQTTGGARNRCDAHASYVLAPSR